LFLFILGRVGLSGVSVPNEVSPIAARILFLAKRVVRV
jgi:hypothetical protein